MLGSIRGDIFQVEVGLSPGDSHRRSESEGQLRFTGYDCRVASGSQYHAGSTRAAHARSNRGAFTAARNRSDGGADASADSYLGSIFLLRTLCLLRV